MKTMGLNHIQIKVSDLNESLKFYTGLLGMKEISRQGRLVFLQSARGNDVVTLQQIDEPVDVSVGGLEHFGFSVPREEHAAAVEEAQKFGCEVLDVGQYGDNFLYAYIKDPDGYIIEIGGIRPATVPR